MNRLGVLRDGPPKSWVSAGAAIAKPRTPPAKAATRQPNRIEVVLHAATRATSRYRRWSKQDTAISIRFRRLAQQRQLAPERPAGAGSRRIVNSARGERLGPVLDP